MRNVTTPRTVSFEDALRNLASKLTGTPVKELPRTQEAVVQYMAEHVPSVDEMTGMTNRIDGNADLDGVLTTLTDGFAEALVTAAEGVHE